MATKTETGSTIDADDVARFDDRGLAWNDALAAAKPEFYGRIDVPALIVIGSKDMTLQGAYKLQSAIKGCELVEIEGAGHACNFEMPWEYDRLAIAYLRKRGLFPGQAA